MTLHVPSFGGGVVVTGAAGQRGIDELLEADSLDIGPRGALICTTDREAYTELLNSVGADWSRMLAVFAFIGYNFSTLMAVGEGAYSGTPTYLLQRIARRSAANPLPWGVTGNSLRDPTGALALAALVPSGVIVTQVSFPVVDILDTGGGAATAALHLVNLGAREGFSPNIAPGLYAVLTLPPATLPGAWPIVFFDALGTGLFGPTFSGGTEAVPLYPRGIIAYNNHVFLYGFDNGDAVNGDGPNRVMFSNLGKPLVYGNDNIASSGDRAFTDSDAITLGDAGEIIRGAIKWAAKLWFGTNQQLHYIAGYGRDSFLTDGASPVAKSYNITGAHSLIEGPDRKLYGVADQGLWRTGDGANFEPLFQKLVNFNGQSNGYWDLIWTDESRAADAVPGRTNADLIWMAVDRDRLQVVVGIPHCNSTAGYGPGDDTVLIKFNVTTGGFTRQKFPGLLLTAAAYLRAEGQQPAVKVMTRNPSWIDLYGQPSGLGASAPMPDTLPSVTFGPYAAFGPDGRGALKRLYLTVSWAAATALPLVFHITTTVDEASSDDFLLTIGSTAPVGPAVDDIWLDTSLTDSNIGNATAGAITTAFPAALLKRWTGTAWSQLPGVGSNGLRAVIRLPLEPRDGTWITATAECTAAAGRFQFEALGEKPGGGVAAA